MAGSYISNIGSVDFALPASAPVVVAAPQFGRDLLKILGDSLDIFLWGEGAQLAASPLKMLDAANGREVTEVVAGATIGQNAGYLNNKPHFIMPGGLNGQFRANYQVPASYCCLTVLRTPATFSGVPIFGANVGVGLRHRIFAATYEYIHGSGTGNMTNVTGTSAIPGSADCLLWASYNAVDQSVQLGVNSLNAKMAGTVVLPVTVAGQTDFGGQAASGSFTGPLGMQAVTNRALHGSTDADTLRRSALARIAANFGIALT